VIITEKKKADDELLGWLAERAWLGALTIASLVGVLLICGVSAAATHHHAGRTHAPKTLVASRSVDRHTGHHVPVVNPKTAKPPITHARHAHHR
jgi:hypothetical protein